MSKDSVAPPPTGREPMTPRRSNADFRKLMATPRRPSSDSAPTPTSAPEPTEMKPPPKKKQKKWKPQKPKIEDELSSKYRDRAKERRIGDNPDYQDVQAELSTGFTAVPPPREGSKTEEERMREIEQSKYLGGDMEHTHLVKGLDFALLNKIRSEIQKQQQVEKQEKYVAPTSIADLNELIREQARNEAKEKDQAAKGKTSTPSASKAGDAPETEETRTDGPQFKSNMGRNLFNFLFDEEVEVVEEDLDEAETKSATTNKTLKQKQNKPKLTKRELMKKRVGESFLKGRTTYVFDVENKYSQSDIPTIMLRSKRDCPQRGERMVSHVPNEVFQKVSTIMAYLRPVQKSKKQKEKKKSVLDLVEPVVELVNNNKNQQEKGKEKEERTSVMSLGFIKPTLKKPEVEKGISSLFEDIIGKAPSKAIDLDDDDIFPDVGTEYVCKPTKQQEEEAKKKLEEQKAASEAKPEAPPSQAEPKHPATLYEKELAARMKSVEGGMDTQDYFGTGKKRKRDEEEEKAEAERKEKAEKEEQTVKQKEQEEEEEREKEREARRKRKAEKEIAEQFVEELIDDAKGSKRRGIEIEEEKQPQEGSYDVIEEQPMEGVEEGPVGPQMPSSPSSYDVAMPAYADADAYMSYPEAPADEDYEAYPDTDAQYATTTTTTTTQPSNFAVPLPVPRPGVAPVAPVAEKEQPAVAKVVTKTLSDQERKDRGLSTVFRRDDQRFANRPKPKDEREKNPGFVPNDYAECYPGAYESEFHATVVDDDSDEEDFSKMDIGTKARKKVRPWHFESDEAWNKYNEQMEATPKAAYQFGVKVNDGRKKGKLGKKKKTEEAKINEQLKKITELNAKKNK